MKIASTSLALLGVAGMSVSSLRPQTVTLVIGGDTAGYLSPCGCTKPMSGGIKRRIAMMKQFDVGDAVLVESGGLVGSASPQESLKLNALAQALSQAGFDAVNVGFDEAQLGQGDFTNALNLLGNKALSSTAPDGSSFDLRRVIVAGPFAIAGIDARSAAMWRALGESARSTADAMDELIATATADDKIPIVLFQGSLEAAKALPRIGEVALVVYRSQGPASDRATTVGSTAFVSPGEKGKSVLTVTFEGRLARVVTPHELTADVPDDPATSKIYNQYLTEVGKSGLLSAGPRFKTPTYAGSRACASCHPAAFEKWKSTPHSWAYGTLVRERHGLDPECVNCHVVGLRSTSGFVPQKTPGLASVGCESCHGPAAAHAKKPTVKLPKVGLDACQKCHTPNHSPQFDPALAWKRIAH